MKIRFDRPNTATFHPLVRVSIDGDPILLPSTNQKKKDMIKRLSIATISLLMAIAMARAATFTGCVLDENQVPMPYVNVLLLNSADSTFVQGSVTGEDGVFSIAGELDTGI